MKSGLSLLDTTNEKIYTGYMADPTNEKIVLVPSMYRVEYWYVPGAMLTTFHK